MTSTWAAATTWKRIDTAPKDGRFVLLNVEGVRHVAYFENQWYTYHGHLITKATHWADLPDGPEPVDDSMPLFERVDV